MCLKKYVYLPHALVPAAEIRDHETGLVSGPFFWFQSRQLFLETHETNSISQSKIFSKISHLRDRDFAASQIDLDLLSYQNVMPYRLKNIFEALKTILPSSIESERTFSVTGFYITKFRWSLGDQSINALFLKHIFEKREQEEKDRIEKKD